MENGKLTISNKTVAFNGVLAAVAAVFMYAGVVMVYAIIRSTFTIYSIMPAGGRNTILLTNGFSIAYSVGIFSLIMAALSSLVGAVGAIVLKKILQYCNPEFNFKKAVLVSCIQAFALLTLMYLLLYSLMKDWVTFNYVETFTFWFLIPAAIFFLVYVIGGIKLNTVLRLGLKK